MYRWIGYCAIVFATARCGNNTSLLLHLDDTSPGVRFHRNDSVDFKVIGHRGYSGEAPENTLASIRRALDFGTDMVEFDVRRTADSTLRLMHDATLSRTTNADERFQETALQIEDADDAFINLLDAGSWFDPQYTSEPIPTLYETIEFIGTESIALIEHKSGTAEQYLAELADVDPNRVVIQSFDWTFLQNIRRIDPRVRLVPLGKWPMTESDFRFFKDINAWAIHWHKNEVSHADIDRLHQSGFEVWAYTVNSFQESKQLLSKGFDGITTDHPRRIR